MFLASQTASRKDNMRNKKTLTTSVGSGTSDESYTNTTLKKSRDKTDMLGIDYVIAHNIINIYVCIYNITEDNAFESKDLQVITEKKDTEQEGKVLVGGKDSVESSHDVNEEEEKSQSEVTMYLQEKNQLNGLEVQSYRQ